jgi:site-specific DNA recombinase
VSTPQGKTDAVFYGRNSTRKQEEANTIETQIDHTWHDPVVLARFNLPADAPVHAHLAAKKNGARKPLGDVPGWYLDEGVTGYKRPLWERPQGKRLLDDARAGKLKGKTVLIYKYDRAGRKATDTEQAVTELIECGVSIYDVKGRLDIDNNTPTGKMFRQMLGIMAEYERNTTADRMFDGLERKARSEELLPTALRLGYDWTATDSRGHKAPGADMVINAKEAELVHLIFELYELEAQTRVGLILNEHGHRLPCKVPGLQDRYERTERLFSSQDVRRIVADPIYTGMVGWGCTTKRPGYTPTPYRYHRTDLQIISFEQFNRVGRTIQEKAKVPRRSGSSPWIYSGLLRCPRCGGPTVGTPLSRSSGGYVCRNYNQYGKSGCAGWWCAESTVNRAVIPFLTDLLENRINIRQQVARQATEQAWEKNEGRAGRLKGQMEAAKEQLKRIQTLAAEGIMTPEEARPFVLGARETIERAERELVEVGQSVAAREALEETVRAISSDIRGLLERSSAPTLKAIAIQVFKYFTISRRGHGLHVVAEVIEPYELREEVQELLAQNSTNLSGACAPDTKLGFWLARLFGLAVAA